MKTKRFNLAYGTRTVEFSLPWPNVVQPEKPLDRLLPVDIEATLRSGLSHPRGDPGWTKRIKPGARVCLVCDDYTRPTPSAHILLPLLDALNRKGIQDADMCILVAAGFHREMTAEELSGKYGPEICRRIRIVHHKAEAYDTDLLHLGRTGMGIPIWVHREVLEADISIGIGVVEIHPWAGFAGGCKIVSPGVAGKRTIDATHALPYTCPGVEIGKTEGNPFWQSCVEVARKAGLDAVINVVLNRRNQVIALEVGEPVAAQQAAIDAFKRVNELRFSTKPDLVIASSYPKDQYFGQAMIAGYNAARLVRPGGLRIILGACPEGFGDCAYESDYYERSMAADWSSPQVFVEAMRGEEDACSRNCCAVHRYLEDLKNSDCIFVSDGLPADVDYPNLKVMRTIEEAIREGQRRLGPQATVAVIDKAGMVLPVVMPGANEILEIPS